jgi:hypothetical protein
MCFGRKPHFSSVFAQMASESTEAKINAWVQSIGSRSTDERPAMVAKLIQAPTIALKTISAAISVCLTDDRPALVEATLKAKKVKTESEFCGLLTMLLTDDRPRFVPLFLLEFGTCGTSLIGCLLTDDRPSAIREIARLKPTVDVKPLINMCLMEHRGSLFDDLVLKCSADELFGSAAAAAPPLQKDNDTDDMVLAKALSASLADAKVHSELSTDAKAPASASAAIPKGEDRMCVACMERPRRVAQECTCKQLTLCVECYVKIKALTTDNKEPDCPLCRKTM